MTNYQLPKWLNLESMPSEDLCERLTAAIDQFASIMRAVEDFVTTHQPTIVEYHSYTRDLDLPDGVWQTIDTVTGYSNCTSTCTTSAPSSRNSPTGSWLASESTRRHQQADSEPRGSLPHARNQ